MTIESVAFDGNVVVPNVELEQRFLARLDLLQHGYYVEKDVQNAADLVVEWVKSNGYLTAKLVTINPIYPPARSGSSGRDRAADGLPLRRRPDPRAGDPDQGRQGDEHAENSRVLGVRQVTAAQSLRVQRGHGGAQGRLP